ncbi:hypothetical protein AB0J38_28215 [Streptomyces sp. NPDC050095]|uniref:hypothetical protein n=1 Tax=unclassified Streptomyces TaxID=2593676 RepID=UPI0034482C50
MGRTRIAAVTTAAVVVLGSAMAFTVMTSLDKESVRTTREALLATDVSKDEYLADASHDIFHGTVVGLASQARTDQPGEMEQRWRVRVDRAFKGAASGTVTVSTTAYIAKDGSLTARGGAVVPEEGRTYVFSGYYASDEDLYCTFGGTTGTRLSPALGQPLGHDEEDRMLHPERSRGLRTVEDYWADMVDNAVQGPVLH